METHRWGADISFLASEIWGKTPDDVEKYLKVFNMKCKKLADYSRIKACIEEDEAKRQKRENLKTLLSKKFSSVRHPIQELELNYPTTIGKVYSEEEDRYILCRVCCYGITEFPVFRFDWFSKNYSSQEFQRRCNALLGMIEKEDETRQSEEAKSKPTKGKKRGIDKVQKVEKQESRPVTPIEPSSAKRSTKKKKT